MGEPRPSLRVFKGRREWAATIRDRPWTVLVPVPCDNEAGWMYAGDTHWPTWREAYARARRLAGHDATVWVTRDELTGHIEDPICCCFMCRPEWHTGVRCNCPWCLALKADSEGDEVDGDG